ncbi:MAG: rhodanese-like domain-containing protein [Clostridia bacterium]|nr:rhodanese-like domain-containing protein [Clostridia bacterium]
MKRAIVCMLLAAVLLASAALAAQTYRQITQEEARRIMEEEQGYLILDVRTAEEYAEGHIPGAINIDNAAIGADGIPELPDKDRMILVYCRSGRRSKEASEKLAAMGYANIFEFGGINTWTGEIAVGEEP